MVAVEADLGAAVEAVPQGADAGGNIIRQHVTGGIRAIDAVGPVGFHQPGLSQELFRRRHVGHHQKAHRVQFQLARQANVLFGHIRLSAVGGDADDADAAVPGHVQMLHGAYAGQQQGGNRGVFHARRHRLQVFLVGGGGKAVIDGSPPQPIAVGDFDEGNAGLVQGAGETDHLLHADLVGFGVHAVAQAHVVQLDALAP